jgi:hypothetical protein
LATLLSATLRRRRHGALGKSWYVDETYVKVGRWRLTGASIMCTHRLWRAPGIVVLLAMIGVRPAAARLPTYGVGRLPTPEEVRAWDLTLPHGKTTWEPASK